MIRNLPFQGWRATVAGIGGHFSIETRRHRRAGGPGFEPSQAQGKRLQLRIQRDARLLDGEQTPDHQQRQQRQPAIELRQRAEPARRQHSQQRNGRQHIEPDVQRRIGFVINQDHPGQRDQPPADAPQFGEGQRHDQHDEQVQQVPGIQPGVAGLIRSLGRQQPPAGR